MSLGIREESYSKSYSRNLCGVTRSPGLYIIRARPLDTYQIAVATQLRMENTYQRSTSVGIKAVLRDIGFLGLPRWRS